MAASGKPTLLSTGMATLAEVAEAVSVILETGRRDLALLQCTTDYPASLDEINLRAMATMAETFGLPVGYSDHTVADTACVAAVALGEWSKVPGPSERRNSPGMRRGLVVRWDVPAGEVLTADILTSKRPAVGLTPRDIDQVIGLRARVPLAVDQPLHWWMLDKTED